MTEMMFEAVHAAYESVAARAGAACDIAIILGSGLGHLADAVQDKIVIPYHEIAGFPVSTAPSHAGKLVFGELYGKRVVMMQGRFHLYEGWNAQDILKVIHVLKMFGAHTLVVTNAAGGLNANFRAGDIMAITDHMNFTGTNPLIGVNDERLGLRFPDMSQAYTREYIELVREVAAEIGIAVHEGIYVGLSGPSLETSAERRYYRAAGADTVGMSTVLEVISAVHAGFKVIGFSGITNAATGGPDQQPDTIEGVIANAALCGAKIDAILQKLLPKLT